MPINAYRFSFVVSLSLSSHLYIKTQMIIHYCRWYVQW